MELSSEVREYIDLAGDAAATRAIEKIEPRIRSLENWRAYMLGGFAVASIVFGVVIAIIK